MDDANNQVLEWRKLDGPIPWEVWESGYWLYGLRGQYHSKGGWSKYFPTHLNMTDTGEWWAPCNADGSPRPWPDAKPQTPEWRKISCATDLTGYWLCGGIGADPNYCPLRTGGGFHRTGSGEWWAPVNADGTPRSWPDNLSMSSNSSPAEEQPQPAPQPGTVDVWPLVIEDMRRRDADGRRQYGTPLQAHNGRDALVDAYHEALDLAVYLRQEIVQREDAAAEIAALQADNDRLRVKIACASDLANLAASDDQVRRDSEVHTAHALVYLRIARAASDDQDYWIRLARESREHAREARKEEREF